MLKSALQKAKTRMRDVAMEQPVLNDSHRQKLAHVEIDGARIERLCVKETAKQVVSFSWWPNGKMAGKPLEVPEEHLLLLIKAAIDEDVLTEDFVWELRSLLDPFLTNVFRPRNL